MIIIEGYSKSDPTARVALYETETYEGATAYIFQGAGCPPHFAAMCWMQRDVAVIQFHEIADET